MHAHQADLASHLKNLCAGNSRPKGDRMDERFAVDEPAKLFRAEPRFDGFAVRIRDVSSRGVGLESPEAINPGTCVQIVLRDVFLEGEVRHCSPLDSGYRIGVQMLDVVAVNPADQFIV